MAEGINISLQEVSAISGKIRSLNQDLSAQLGDIKTSMNNLETTWQSEAARTIVANFNALTPKFENYEQVVEQYSKFLDSTVTALSETETAITNNANAFK